MGLLLTEQCELRSAPKWERREEAREMNASQTEMPRIPMSQID